MRQNLNKTCKEMAEEHYDKVGQNFQYVMSQMHDSNNGWVIDVPYSFGMGHFYKDNGEIILHVTYVCGDFISLLRYCLNIEIDKIEFKRNFIGKTRRYDFDKFISRSS